MFQIRSALLLIGSDPNFSSADPMLCLGCLSPEEMLLSAQIGWYAAAFAIGIIFASVLLSLSRGSFVWSLLCVVLLLIHPGVDNGRRQRRLRIRKAFLVGSYLVGAGRATDMSDLLAAV